MYQMEFDLVVAELCPKKGPRATFLSSEVSDLDDSQATVISQTAATSCNSKIEKVKTKL